MENSFFFGLKEASRSKGDREAYAIDVACGVVTGVLVVLTALGWNGLTRVLLSFAFAVYVPGWAVVTNLMPKTRASRQALPVLASLTILTAAATVTLWLRVWHPLQLFDVEAGASVGLIGFAAIRRLKRPPHDMSEVAGAERGEDKLAHHSSVRGLLHSLGDPSFAVANILLLASIALWIVGIHLIHSSPVPLSVLPAGSVLGYLAGLALLVVSTSLVLTRRKFSSTRMALHLGALIVMLYGTAPIVYAEPRFAWVEKHVAITNYIAVHHVLSQSMDIYRIWPGFFAVAAWIDKVAGVSTPLVYAGMGRALLRSPLRTHACLDFSSASARRT